MAGISGILTYAVEAGIIDTNPAHGVRKPKDNVRNRRLTEAEYRTLGKILREAAEDDKYPALVLLLIAGAALWALQGNRQRNPAPDELASSLGKIVRTR